MIRVFGQITDASGKGVPGAMIELRALKSTAEVLYGSVLPYKCDALGNYDFPLAIGAYDAYAQNDACGDMDYLGSAVVAANTTDGDLHHILADGGINITPPMLESAMEYTRRAEQAAASAETDREQTGTDVAATAQNRQVSETKAREAAASADEAKNARDSIVNDAADVRAKAKQVADDAVSVANNTAAVQRNTEQVAQNTQTVSTKAQQVAESTNSVSANTLSVAQMRDEVAAKTSMAQGAADTATQKAASAASHDASAAEYARQAQEAAQATAGALIDGGSSDLSSGVYPQPVMVGSIKRPTFWKVTKGGVVGDVDYGVGDTLIYTTSGGGSYYKIDNTESVTSVQGEKGAVALTPEKIGAEPAGTAAALVDQHAQKDGAHPISSVAGLADALADKIDKAGGTATGSIFSERFCGVKQQVNGEIRYYISTAYQGVWSESATLSGLALIARSLTTGNIRVGGAAAELDLIGSAVKINGGAVYSENNKPSAKDAGADPAGTAASAVLDHEKKSDAHPQYLKNADISNLEDRVTGLEGRAITQVSEVLWEGRVLATGELLNLSSPVTAGDVITIVHSDSASNVSASVSIPPIKMSTGQNICFPFGRGAGTYLEYVNSTTFKTISFTSGYGVSQIVRTRFVIG